MSSKINLQKPPTAQGRPWGRVWTVLDGSVHAGAAWLSGPTARVPGQHDARVSGRTGLHVLGSGEHRPHFGHEILHGETHGVPMASCSDPARGPRVRECPMNVSAGRPAVGPRSPPGSGPTGGAEMGTPRESRPPGGGGGGALPELFCSARRRQLPRRSGRLFPEKLP